MKVEVLHNQTFLDIAVQYTGDVSNAYEIAYANGLSISDELVPGSSLTIPNEVKVNTDIQVYFNAKLIKPATKVQPNLIEIAPLGGINYWEIETTFEVQ